MQSVFKYWGQCASRGDKPQAVYVVLKAWWNAADLGDHVAHWELTRQRAARWVANQADPAAHTICKIEYLSP